METLWIDGLTLCYDSEEREAAALIRDACRKSVEIIHECWGLATPGNLRVYVMTSWLSFAFRAAPWPWRILLAVALPLWGFRARRLWPYAGGFSQQYGRRRAVGVKPPRLLQASDRSIGDRVFVRKADVAEEVQHVTCHELVHAFSAHLRLPMWLNEGLAIVTVDHLAGRPTVRRDTLEILDPAMRAVSPGSYRAIEVKDQDPLVYHVVRGYWITRYLKEMRPEIMDSILSQRYSHQALESEVAAALGKSRDEFWGSIDGDIVSHFRHGQGSGRDTGRPVDGGSGDVGQL